MGRKSHGSRLYEIRFTDPQGRMKTFTTIANNPNQAKKKLKQKGVQVLWIKKP